LIEEEQLINYWLKSKDYAFLAKHGLDKSYFLTTGNVIDWIDGFYKQSGILPSIDTVVMQFDNVSKWEELEPIDYLINVVKENKAYTEFRPILIKSAELLNEKKTFEALWNIRNNADNLLNKYTTKYSRYDWVKDAEKRYEEYMKKHNKKGLSGITSGISTLDEYTGGWRDDDLILISGRTGEGKSYLGTYFLYSAWTYLLKTDLTNPVVYITTEMPELEVSYRLDSIKAHFSSRDLNEGGLLDAGIYKEYLHDLTKCKNSFLILGEDSNGGRAFTPEDILKIIETEHPAMMVIDQLYDLSDGTNERDIRKRIVNVSTAIREINLSTKTPIILITQAGRESAKESKKDVNATPELYHVQESDNPVQKATRVLTLRTINDEVMKISLKKNRGGKKNKDIFMRVDFDRGIWEESTPEEMVF
jgi:replicative DNA helicase